MLVIWSGGCDSTWVLFDLARYATQENPVRAVSFSHPQCYGSVMEKRARTRILKELRRRHFPIEHIEVETRMTGPFEGVTSMLIQPVLWLQAVEYLRRNEDLYTGYVMGDQFWHYKSEFKTAFLAMQEIKGGTGVLHHRLEWVSKREVLGHLRSFNLDSLCWWCEVPNGNEPCGLCASCVTHAMALVPAPMLRDNAEVQAVLDGRRFRQKARKKRKT